MAPLIEDESPTTAAGRAEEMLRSALTGRDRASALLTFSSSKEQGIKAEMTAPVTIAEASSAAVRAALVGHDAESPARLAVLTTDEESFLLPSFGQLCKTVASRRVVFVVQDAQGKELTDCPRFEGLSGSAAIDDDDDGIVMEEEDEEVLGGLLGNIAGAVRHADRSLTNEQVDTLALVLARLALLAARRLADPANLLSKCALRGLLHDYERKNRAATRCIVRVAAFDWSPHGLGVEFRVAARAKFQDSSTEPCLLGCRALQRTSIRPSVAAQLGRKNDEEFHEVVTSEDMVVLPLPPASLEYWVEEEEGSIVVEPQSEKKQMRQNSRRRAACSSVMGFGENALCCLGGDVGKIVVEPCEVFMTKRLFLPLERVRSVACSARHTLVLTWQRRVYSCGDGEDGALGLGGRQHTAQLAAVDWLEESQQLIVCVAAGADVFGTHSAAVGVDGSLYTWGLGVATAQRTTHPVLRPARVEWTDDREPMPKVSVVKAGGSFCVALDLDGRALAWGLWLRGRLGLGETPELRQNQQAEQTGRKRLARFQISPRYIDGHSFSSVDCGEQHCLGIESKTGRLLAWGCNEHGQLGVGTNHKRVLQDHLRPVVVKGACSFTQVACGATHSVAVDSEGGVWTWGGGGGAMLGQGACVPSTSSSELAATTELMTRRVLETTAARGSKKSTAHLMRPREMEHALPRKLELSTKVSSVSCGERHTAFVTELGGLMLCGEGVAMLGSDALQQPELATASVGAPRCPNARWLASLSGKAVDAVYCGGQHTVVLCAGERAARSVGRRLHQDARKATRLLARDEGEGEEEDEDEGTFDAVETPRECGVDCMLIPGGGLPIYAHLAVLSNRSPKFAELILLESREDGQEQGVLQLLCPDLSPAAAPKLLEFIYCDDLFESSAQLNYHPSLLAELAQAAVNYSLPRLAQICHDLLGTTFLGEEEQQVIVLEDSTLSSDLAGMVGEEAFSDVKIVAETEVIHVHRSVLEVRSDFFKAMFASGMRETAEEATTMCAEVSVADTAESMRRLMRLIYTDALQDGDPGQLVEDLLVADRYGLVQARTATESTLASSLSNASSNEEYSLGEVLLKALQVVQAVGSKSCYQDVLSMCASNLALLDLQTTNKEILADILQERMRLRPETLRPGAPPTPVVVVGKEEEKEVAATSTLSVPHAVGLVVMVLLVANFQARYRLQPAVVTALNTVFMGLVVVLFWHSAKLKEYKRKLAKRKKITLR